MRSEPEKKRDVISAEEKAEQDLELFKIFWGSVIIWRILIIIGSFCIKRGPEFISFISECFPL